MSTAVVVSHTSVAHELGHLAPWLSDSGIRVTRAYREAGASWPEADLLIVLGSPASVADGYLEPPARAEVEHVRDWVLAGRPYLGICFGAQVLAVALGGTVRRMPATFRGYVAMDSTADSGLAGPWTTWHNDSVTAPPGAEVLGSLEHAHLAFRAGRAWGVQAHVEVTPDSLARMGIGLHAEHGEYQPLVRALSADVSNAARASGFLAAFAHHTLGAAGTS